MKCGAKKGTCDPRCETYGLCHCGCGRKTNVAAQSRSRNPRNRIPTHQIRGRHFAFCAGHTPGSGFGRKKGPGTRRVHDPDEVGYYARVLVSEYGLRGSARMTGVHYVTMLRLARHNHGCYEAVYQAVRREFRKLDTCPVRVSVAPLFAYLADRRYEFSTAFDETTRRRLYRWRNEGTVNQAKVDDFITSELGLHPTAVYGPDWYADEDVAS